MDLLSWMWPEPEPRPPSSGGVLDGFFHAPVVPPSSNLPPPEQAVIFATIFALLAGLLMLQQVDPSGASNPLLRFESRP